MSELRGSVGDRGVVRDDLFRGVDGVDIFQIAGEHLRGGVFGDGLGAGEIDLELLRGIGGVDDFEGDFTGGVDFVGAGEEGAGGDGAVDGVEEGFSVEEAVDVVAGDIDADVVPAVGLDVGVGGAGDFGVAAGLEFFDGGAGVSPAADVEPEVVVGILNVEEDEEAFIAIEFAGFEGVGVIGPGVVAGGGAAIGIEGGLVEGGIIGAPVAIGGGPVVGVFGEVGVVEVFVGAGDGEVFVFDIGGPASDADGPVRFGGGGAGALGDDVGGEDAVAAAVGEHFLGVVGGGVEAGEGVVADEVGAPLRAAAVHVDQERGVALHDDDVGIVFKAGEEGGIAECGIHGGGGVAVL